MNEPSSERRRHPRFSVRFKSSFSSVNMVDGEGALADLSVRGCRLESRIDVKPGTELQLTIDLPDEPSALDIAVAIVRWSRAGTFGIEFMDMKDDQWKRLGRFMKTFGSAEAGTKAHP